MKLIVKIFLSLLILCMLLLASPLILFLWIKLYISYERNHTENIDTTFFSQELRNELITDIKDIIKTTDINTSYIEIDIDYIIFYNLNNNITSKYNIAWFNINNIFQKLNITFITIYLDNNGGIKNIDMSLNLKKYLYVYESKKHNYSEWYVIPVLAWRVEKVIDDNWYILRDCDRTICQEPQR